MNKIVNIIILLLVTSNNTYAVSIKQNINLKLSDNNDISINFSDNNMVYGNAGCNSYSGGYKLLKNNNIHINRIASTLMYCQGKMDDEYNFLKKLEEVNTYKVNNNILELYKDNNLLLKFKE